MPAEDLRKDDHLDSKWFLPLAGSLIAFHALFVIAAGPTHLTFLSGGSDAPAYALTASNLLHHRGFTFAGMPTALFPPGYPLFLATAEKLFGWWYVLATRWVQFFVCLGTAWICGRTSQALFGRAAGQAGFLAALLLPTQVFASAQILTECLATFFIALFLYAFVRELKRPSIRTEAGMGVAAVAASLIHFNAAALPLIAGVVILRYPGRRRCIAFAGTMVLPLVLISPWLVRNLIVFHGRVLYSTQTGFNAVQGILTPEGRTQVGDTQKLFRAMGWAVEQVETNNPARHLLPSEAVLNSRCLKLLPGLWEDLGWRAVPLLARKISNFWLSTDQLLDTRSFSVSSRLLRAVGVFGYWGILALAILGWFVLWRGWPRAANVLLAYAAIFTVLHLPLVMSTRIRFPLMDPLLAALAGGGAVHLLGRSSPLGGLVAGEEARVSEK